MLYRLWRQQLLVAVGSSTTTDCVELQTHSKFGEWAFVCTASPTVWNRLPEHIHRQSTPAAFRRHLKTFLFAEVFNTVSNFEQLQCLLVIDVSGYRTDCDNDDGEDDDDNDQFC